MEIMLRYRSCEIAFSNSDPFYPGKKVSLQGEAVDDFTFYVLNNSKLYWVVPSPENPNRYVGISVDDSEKESLLLYIIEKSKEKGFRFILW